MNDQASPKKSRSALPWLVVAVLLLAAFTNRHLVTDQDPRIAPEALAAALEQGDPPLLLDIRSPGEYAAGHIPGAVLVEPRQLRPFAESLEDRNRPIVLYCETGSRSRAARYALKDLGFTDLTQLDGDMRSWRQLDLPVKRSPVPGANPG